MADITIDEYNHFRCWNCGGHRFIIERRGPAGFEQVDVATLQTGDPVLCQACNAVNKSKTPRPWTGSAREPYG